MSRLTLATVAACALLAACTGEEDTIVSEPTGATSDQSTEPPQVDTDPPDDGSDSDEV
jgi:hypothetical protein